MPPSGHLILGDTNLCVCIEVLLVLVMTTGAIAGMLLSSFKITSLHHPACLHIGKMIGE
jgi:hypothetical protein